jgi:peptidoglycan/xylan/chitin deacetylase (PgdA/CDA1 family)
MPAYSTPSCQCVSFRLDDVQDYWLNNVQTKIIDTFHQKNASLTIGIIGNHIGYDSKIMEDIKPKIGQYPKLEIANHGWNHENFTQFSREEQNIFMKNTNDRISDIFGIVPSVFIPPFNAVNSDTMMASFANNFTYISSDVSQDAPSIFIKNARVYHIPGNAETGNLTNNDKIWSHHNNTHILVKIMSDIHKYGYSVVILHPPEYAIRIHSYYANEVDKNQIKNLELLIDNVKDHGIKIVSLNQIPLQVNDKSYPNWLTRIFSWNENGDISDNQVLSIMNYLFDKKIIPINSHSDKL